ncbi:MAG: Gmad2 immunoglobulin-like domain-containing protein [Actinomycetota bacterium]|nr:Gmad2 immunoglobulin-like domain-containing protein [Actinomycetota bacterium]
MVKQSEGHDAFEDRVREALHRAADAVEPSGQGLSAIQARTARESAGGRARARWFTGGAAVLAAAAAVAAVALIGSSDLAGPDRAPVPAGPAVAPAPVEIYYLDRTPERRGEPGSASVDDPGLYREVHSVAVDGGRVEAAVRELASSEPVDPDYWNPWAGAGVNSVEVTRDKVFVDVDAVPRRSAWEPIVQQIAHTVQSAAGRRIDVAVTEQGRLLIDTIAAAPVGTYANIWVTSPEQGAVVSGPVDFSGMAATFEGNVAYEILRGDRVVASGATITSGGMGVWSEWTFTERLAPGDYTLVAFDEDPALGGRRDVETKTFTVR